MKKSSSVDLAAQHVIFRFMSKVPLLVQLDADIANAEADVAKREASFNEALAKLNRLRSAREVISGYAAPYAAQTLADTQGKPPMTSAIEDFLFEEGARDVSTILGKLTSTGYKTNRNSLNTTLWRMKNKDKKLVNDGGVWELSPWRKKELRK